MLVAPPHIIQTLSLSIGDAFESLSIIIPSATVGLFPFISANSDLSTDFNNTGSCHVFMDFYVRLF